MHEQLPFMLALVAVIVLIEMLATKLRIHCIERASYACWSLPDTETTLAL